MDPLIENQQEFLKKFNILRQEYEYNEDLDWSVLKKIYYHYKDFSNSRSLIETASSLAGRCAKMCPKVQSIRYRVKDPSHVVAKIIRRKISNKNIQGVNPDDYLTKIGDIVGIRLLHVFKDDWREIHDMLMRIINMSDKQPFAYVRDGDDHEFLADLKNKNISIRLDEDGYRSIHYKTTLSEGIDVPVSCEIQVRSLFEEAWSEISHATRYPNDQDSPFLKKYFQIYNRLSGALDEMGVFIRDTNQITGNANQTLDSVQDQLKSLIKNKEKLKSLETQLETFRVPSSRNKEKLSIGLRTRKEFFTKAIDSLRKTEGYYRSVIEGPFFLHPAWVFDLRDEYYTLKGQAMPNYDSEIHKFVLNNITNEVSDIKFIIRNSKRYISKLNEYLPNEQRERFKSDMVENIQKLRSVSFLGKFEFLCLKTGFIAVSEIYKTCALESDKKTEDEPLTQGLFHESGEFVEERRQFFDGIFYEHYDDQEQQFENLIRFINSLWI